MSERTTARRWAKAALLTAFALCCSVATKANPPIEAFGQLPLLTSPRFSPDGTQFAVIKPLEGRSAVIIYPVSGDPNIKPKLFNDKDWNIVDIRWANNDRLLVIVKIPLVEAHDLYTQYRTFSLSTKGGESVALFGNEGVWAESSTALIADLTPDDPAHVYMPQMAYFTLAQPQSIWRWTYHIDDLYRVDVNTGKADLFVKGTTSTYDWVMDGSGHLLARLDAEGLHNRPVVFSGTDYWHRIAMLDVEPGKVVFNSGLTEDGKGFVFDSTDAGGRRGLMRLDLSEGASPASLYFDPKFDVTRPIKDERTGRILGAEVTTDKPEFRYFDTERQTLQTSLNAVFPDLAVHMESIDAAGDKAIVAAEGPTTPATYYYFDLAARKKYRIASSYPSLHASDLGEMKPYPYVARDGLAIPAYLTLPPGKTAKNLPVIIMPHGGPEARDALGFDWWAQFLANRGYAVLQPNYRGSSGYGEAFTKAGWRQWGLKMQDDISDGVKQLIADGIADPKRICIVGASYGGYAALAGATLTPDLYACAVSIAGISDLRVLLVRNVPWGTFDRRSITNQLGDRYADSVRLDATSPVLHADQVRCPILLMHGKLDTTVPIEQSEFMRDALKKAGKTVQFVTFDNDDHYFTMAETRIQMLTELEKFLATNIGN